MEPTVRHCQTERRQAHITFLADLAEWKVEYQASPVETVKAFIIYTSGFDVALRNTESGLTLYVMDAQSLWGEEMPAKKRSKTALLAGAKRVARRYYCAQCRMFFEYGQPQDKVTCPFMPQKCKFSPQPVGAAGKAFDLETLTKVYAVSPKLYRRQIAVVMAAEASVTGEGSGQALDLKAGREALRKDLADWGFDTADQAGLERLYNQLGI